MPAPPAANVQMLEVQDATPVMPAPPAANVQMPEVQDAMPVMQAPPAANVQMPEVQDATPVMPAPPAPANVQMPEVQDAMPVMPALPAANVQMPEVQDATPVSPGDNPYSYGDIEPLPFLLANATDRDIIRLGETLDEDMMCDWSNDALPEYDAALNPLSLPRLGDPMEEEEVRYNRILID